MLEKSMSLGLERIRQIVTTGHEDLDQVMMQPLQASGKLIRPYLLLLSFNLFNPITPIVIDVAVAVELIHTASLVHDDIIDRAIIRRGHRTINSIYGDKIAVLAGDHYFAAAFELVAGYGLLPVIGEFTRAISDMCSGEILQDLNLYNADFSEQEYMTAIYGKTASLFACACRCGALTANAPAHQVRLMGDFGKELGLAFQMADDVIDFVGNEGEMGKIPGSDLVNGVITLPVIAAMKLSDEGRWLSSAIKNRDFDQNTLNRALQVITDSGGLEYAARKAAERVDMAWSILEQLPDGMIRRQLYELGKSVLTSISPLLPSGGNRNLKEDSECMIPLQPG